MKPVIGILLLIFSSGLRAQPYVFYRNNFISVQSIESTVVHIDSFPAGDKEKHSVTIHFPENPLWDFSVKLKLIEINKAVVKASGKILFISDIEGEFAGLRQLLINNKVIDENYQWTFGKNKLVVCGDLFDRGLHVIEELWLLYKLETDAKAAGGEVRVLLGNHDIMNLSNDTRYVQPVYFDHARLLGKEYSDLFGENSELGRWLRSKNVIERIGYNLCMHAGMSPLMLDKGLSIDQFNEQLRPWYAQTKSPTFPEKMADYFFEEALFWYRGYFSEPLATEATVDATLQYYGADRIVVGHTIQENVSPFYNGKVFGIDTDWHNGNAQGLLIERNQLYRVNAKGEKYEL